MPTTNPPTPTAVRVARWTACAALISALGSVFSTMWQEKPWWKDPPPVEVHAPAVLPAPKKARETPATVSFTMPKGLSESRRLLPKSSAGEVATVIKPAPVIVVEKQSVVTTPTRTLYQTFLIHLQYHPITTWLIIGSIGVLGIFVVVEFLHRHKHINESLPETVWSNQNAGESDEQ